MYSCLITRHSQQWFRCSPVFEMFLYFVLPLVAGYPWRADCFMPLLGLQLSLCWWVRPTNCPLFPQSLSFFFLTGHTESFYKYIAKLPSELRAPLTSEDVLPTPARTREHTHPGCTRQNDVMSTLIPAFKMSAQEKNKVYSTRQELPSKAANGFLPSSQISHF